MRNVVGDAAAASAPRHPAGRIDNEPRLDHDQEHVGPWPLVVGGIEAEPQIQAHQQAQARRRRVRTGPATATRRSQAPRGKPAGRTRHDWAERHRAPARPAARSPHDPLPAATRYFRPSKLGGIFHSVCCHHIAPISTRNPRTPRLRGVRCVGSRRQASTAMLAAAIRSSQNTAVNQAGSVRKCDSVVQRIGPHGVCSLMPAPAVRPPARWSHDAAGRYNRYQRPGRGWHGHVQDGTGYHAAEGL